MRKFLQKMELQNWFKINIIVEWGIFCILIFIMLKTVQNKIKK